MAMAITNKDNGENVVSSSTPATLFKPHNHKPKSAATAEFVVPDLNLDEKYQKIIKIGQGTFGEVFKARNLSANECQDRKFVALKRMIDNIEMGDLPMTAIYELRILLFVKHMNMVNLIEVFRTKTSSANGYRSDIYLVYEFCEHDLAGLLSNVNVKFSLAEIKKIMQQLLNGLYYIHSLNIMHRDVKPANILITKNGILKLADFGLARFGKKNGKVNCYTNRVVTLWYRPPELLLGDRNYGPAIDIWGAGCIMGEMWTRMPIMQGATEQQQIQIISQLCGSITPDVWPGVTELNLYNKVKLPSECKRKIKDRLKAYVKDETALDLIDKLLTLDPKARIDADTALNHDFIWFGPWPCDLTQMLRQHKKSMFEYTERISARVK